MKTKKTKTSPKTKKSKSKSKMTPHEKRCAKFDEYEINKYWVSLEECKKEKEDIKNRRPKPKLSKGQLSFGAWGGNLPKNLNKYDANGTSLASKLELSGYHFMDRDPERARHGCWDVEEKLEKDMCKCNKELRKLKKKKKSSEVNWLFTEKTNLVL